jgi:formylglycine-generating enzyme required for sulfatase activity
MSGNVLEWCWEWFGDYPSSTQDNPYGPATGTYRVFRGGWWSYGALACCSAFRFNGTPTSVSVNIGFRVCRGVAAH